MIFDSLPQGWAIAKTSEAIETKGIIADGDWIESKDQDPNGDVRLIQLADIGDGDFRDKSERFMTSENAKRMNCTFLEIGDLLIARMPDPLGRACIFPGISQKAVTVVDICLIRPNSGSALQNKLLMYWINSPKVRNFIAMQATGTTRKRITRKKLEELVLPIPPLAEQQQIAAKLDELLAQVDTLKTRLDAIPKILKRFRQSVLAAAVSGKLTEDWRNDKQYTKNEFGWYIPSKWQLLLIDDIAEVKGGKRLPKGEVLVSENTGFPYIRAGQLKGGTVIENDQLFLLKHVQAKISRYIVNKGDIYITIVGACIGDAGIIPSNYDGANLTENAAKLCLFKKPLKKKFLSSWLRSQYLQDIIQHEIKSGAQGKLALKRIKTLPFPYPTIEEQTEIVNRVEQLFAYADQIEQRVKDAQARVNHLTQSILAKAFRGELTAEWREQNPELISGENSAEASLAKIKAEREKAKNKKSK